MRSATQAPPGDGILARVGLLLASLEALQELSIAYSIYHGVKCGELEAAKEALRSGHFEHVANAARSFAGIAASHMGRT